MVVGYVADWIEFHSAVIRTAERWERQPEFAKVAEELFLACRDGNIRTRWPHTPLNECIPLDLWNHSRHGGAPANISQVLVCREDLESLWRAAEAAQETAAASKAHGKPGPKPVLRTCIAEKMLDDLCSGRCTGEELKGDTLSALVAQYGGSQNTAKVARADALGRFAELQNSEL